MASEPGSQRPDREPSRSLRADNRYSPYPPNPQTPSNKRSTGTQPGQTLAQTTSIAGTLLIQPTSSSTLQASLTQLRAVLRELKGSLTLLPPVQSMIDGLDECLADLQIQEPARCEYEELVLQLVNLADLIEHNLVKSNTRALPHSITNFIQDIEEQISLVRSLRDGTWPKQSELAGDELESVLECYRKIGALSKQLQDDITSSVWDRTQVHQMNTQIKDILPVYEAYYDAALSATATKRGACTKNTRVALLDGAWTWTRTDDGVKIYWLNGMAGTGKTTIAYTLCKMLQEANRLGASFFCSRNSPDCRDINKIVPTIAYQLGKYSNPYRQMLCTILDEDPDVTKRGISAQFEIMISKPLMSVGKAMPNNVVVVIDALDECTDVGGTKDVLDTLLQHAACLPIKFFVASRPEPVISQRMAVGDGAMRSILWLHDVEQSLVQADIREYLTEALRSVLVTAAELDALVDRAGCLFIFAATAVRYILPDSGSVNPRQRLQRILNVDSSRGNKSNQDVDSLYATILLNALDDHMFEDDELEQRRRVLWTVVCAREPLEMSALAELLNMGVEAVEPAIQPLQSVLHVSEITTAVTTLHASFPDFLLDKERSGRFHCDENDHHSYLAECCFTIMGRMLRFNICGLESSYRLDQDVPNLQGRVDEAISTGLFYACRYWGDHLTKCPAIPSLLSDLASFLEQHLLFWMEVLNLKRRIDHGDGILGQVFAWLLRKDDTTSLQDFTHDARSFVSAFSAGTSSLSTPHIYISSLPFTPKQSRVRKAHWPKTKGLLQLEGIAFENRGSMALTTWSTGEFVMSIAQSSDGSRIVSGSWSWPPANAAGTVNVWDASGGTRILGPLEGHKGPVTVALSPDDTQIVSGSSDQTICIWNAKNGSLIDKCPHGHTEGVNSISFSPDGAHLASGSSDCTIRIWDASLGTFLLQHPPLVGHQGPVRSVIFSPDGTHIASCSDDCMIRLWEWRARKMAGEPFSGHTGAVRSIAYSHDGLRLVTGSVDSTVRVWDAASGALLAGPFSGNRTVHSVSFAPNSAHIVACSWDQAVCVLDVENGTLLAGPLQGHTQSVTAVQFSVDGTRIFSGSLDGTIHVWDARHMSTCAIETPGLRKIISLLVLSPDGTRLASGSGDRTISIWDTLNGTLVAGPLEGHKWINGSVAFSPDGGRIAFDFCDCTLCSSNASTGASLASPFVGQRDAVNSVTLSLDGNQTQSDSYDYTTQMWNPHSRAPVAVKFKVLDVRNDSVVQKAFSPNGSRIVTCHVNNAVRMWDANNGTVLWTSRTHKSQVDCVAFSSDGTQVAFGLWDSTILVLDARDGVVLHRSCTGTRQVLSLAFSPDGSQLVSGSIDHIVRVWCMQSGTMLVALEGHSAVSYVLFSNARLISGSWDGTIRFWDLAAATQPDATFHNDLKMQKDGWLTNSREERLLRVPTDLRRDFSLPSLVSPLVIRPNYSISIANSTLFLGEQWHRCYK